MKVTNEEKRGFTIVELVIVIAVIAILAAVLIPVFSGIVSNSQEKARQMNLRNAYVEYCSKNANNDKYYSQNDIFFAINGYIYKFDNGKYSAIILEDESKLTEEFATESGYYSLETKYNNLNSYILWESVELPSNPEANTSNENNNTTSNQIDSETLTDLGQIWNNIKLTYTPDVIFITKNLGNGYYVVYSVDDDSGSNFTPSEEITLAEFNYIYENPNHVNSYLDNYDVWSIIE